jgi:selenocysteine lyase/cysteine desulfurase
VLTGPTPGFRLNPGPLRPSRRAFLHGAGITATAGLLGACANDAGADPATAAQPFPPDRPTSDVAALAGDEEYWAAIARNYPAPGEIANLDYGFFGGVANHVLADFEAASRRIATEHAVYMRTSFPGEREAVRQKVAEVAGVDVGEIALTRGATESLQLLISNYNLLRAGDQVLYADLDYDSMQYAMEWLRDRRGVETIKFAIPEPATRQGIIDAYEQQLRDNPRIKLVLLTHVSHRTGITIPVAEISEMCAARGADTIIDAAHSWGQIPFTLRDLKSPFVGLNLHKWMGAPLGVGALYIAKDRRNDIDRQLLDEDYPADDIRSRTHTGTTNSANVLAAKTALEFHQQIGAGAVHARVQFLRDRWVAPLRADSRIEILTPDDRDMYAALTSFRIKGRGSAKDSSAIASWLMENHKLLVVRRGGIAAGDVIRCTPAPFTPIDHMDQAAAAFAAAAGEFAL